MTKPTLNPESELLKILPMGCYVPLDTTDVRIKILDLIAKVEQRAIEMEREKTIKEIIKYQNGFVKDDGAGEGNYLFAPEFGVIDDLLKSLTPPTTNERKE